MRKISPVNGLNKGGAQDGDGGGEGGVGQHGVAHQHVAHQDVAHQQRVALHQHGTGHHQGHKKVSKQQQHLLFYPLRSGQRDEVRRAGNNFSWFNLS